MSFMFVEIKNTSMFTGLPLYLLEANDLIIHVLLLHALTYTDSKTCKHTETDDV